MRDMNTVQLLGNVASEINFKELGDGNGICNFDIATNRSYKDKQEKKIEEATFSKCVAFGTHASTINAYVKKGDRLMVRGRLHNRNYVDKNEVKRYVTEVVVEEIFLMNQRDPAFRPANTVKTAAKQDDGEVSLANIEL